MIVSETVCDVIAMRCSYVHVFDIFAVIAERGRLDPDLSGRYQGESNVD
jgi:hypothetical protein